VVNSKNAGLAWLVREVNHLWASVEKRGEAVVSQADVALGLIQGACGWRTDGHTEALVIDKISTL
jgi:hypothetical protein